MRISVHIPAPLRVYCGGANQLLVTASSVRAALAQLEQTHPELYTSVCDETGSVRRHVNLFVNDTFVHNRKGLDTALAPSDVLTIMPAVSGG